jgi:hypothetical protein
MAPLPPLQKTKEWRSLGGGWNQGGPIPRRGSELARKNADSESTFEGSLKWESKQREQPNRFSLFALDDTTEKADNCAEIYHKSLLYLVSDAFEAQINIPLIHPAGEPLLGMAKFVSKPQSLSADSSVPKNLIRGLGGSVLHRVALALRQAENPTCAHEHLRSQAASSFSDSALYALPVAGTTRLPKVCLTSFHSHCHAD